MDWMRLNKIYFLISAILIAAGLFGLLNWGLKLGLDFSGGTTIEYRFKESISAEEVLKKIEEKGLQVSSLQESGEGSYLVRLPPISSEDRQKLTTALQEVVGEDGFEELKFEVVGPTIGPELIKKTIYATVIASFAILAWVAYQFRSLKFGTCAVLAMFHDTFNLVGLFSILGYFFGAEIDFLFVTALLTTLSFSVHDTIVVYDRIRESQRKFGGELYGLANRAVSETMVRSLNNSFTILFMLLALILLGGVTVRWFAVALFIGTILGTYSSPFVAVPLLVTWDQILKKMRK